MHNIQLFIHDSFFDSFAVLPRQIQRKTRELMKKFRSNPTSTAINYEKIKTFKDQTLRTVRVDDKYRAIVQAPESGDGYHLLWVDNHDEAMNWAKNKIFKWNQETQGFQLFEEPTIPKVVLTQDKPVTFMFSFVSDEDLLKIGTPAELVSLVRSLSSVNELNDSKANLPLDMYEYLFYLAEGVPLAEILEDIESGKETVNPMQSSNARKHAFVVTEDAELEKILNGEFDKWKVFLHPSQRTLAYRDYNGPLKVTGGAGTGKTVCALHRAKFLVDQLGVYNKPILFTTYTKSLTQYLQQTVKGLGIDEDRLHIINIDRLVADLCKSLLGSQTGLITSEQSKKLWEQALEISPSQFDTDFFLSEYDEVITPQKVKSLEEYLTASRLGRNSRIGRKDKMEIWPVVEAFKKLKGGNFSKIECCQSLADHFSSQVEKPFSHIICDEIQDFTVPELSLLRTLVEEKPNDLFLVGDPFQNIYQKKLNFAKAGISVKGRRSRQLKINYRTTEEIKKLATRVVADVKIDNLDGGQETLKGYLSLLHGSVPSYLTFLTPEEEDNFLATTLSDLISLGKIKPNEICIACRTNTKLDELKKILNSNDIRYSDLGSLKNQSNAVNVSTFHNIKGHEFKVVIAKDMSEATIPFRFPNYNNLSENEKKQYNQQERSLYYVVFSRAISDLIVTGVGEKSEWLNMI